MMDRRPLLVSTTKHGSPGKEEGGWMGGVVEKGMGRGMHYLKRSNFYKVHLNLE